ncbi:MAG: hypothetical protein V3T70_04840 [Phycisphaerae bacterium]
MQAEALRSLLREHPFEPIELSLSDGRSIAVRHPDQAAVTARKVFVGLADLRRRSQLASPANGATIAKDWILVDLVHIVSVEPLNGSGERARRRRRG